MEVTVKKSVLFNFLKNALNEDARGDMFLTPQNFSGFEDLEDDKPIEASPQVALQLSEQEPPVGDEEYVPASLEELGLAANVMMREVPRNQIEFVYRFLHKILDMALDKNDEENDAFLLEALDPQQMKVIQDALPRVLGGEPLDAISRELALSLGADEEEVEAALGDAMMAGFSQAEPTKPAQPAQPKPTVRRRPARKQEAPPPPEPAKPYDHFDDEDMSSNARYFYNNAEDREAFLSGYTAGAMTGQAGNEKEDVSGESNDYITGYDYGYSEYFYVSAADLKARAPDEESELSLEDLNAPTPIEIPDLTNMSDEEAIDLIAVGTSTALSMFALMIEVLESQAPYLKTQGKVPAHVKHNISNYKTYFIRNYDSSERRVISLFKDQEKLAKETERQILIFFNHGLDFFIPVTATGEASKDAANAYNDQQKREIFKAFKAGITKLQMKLGTSFSETVKKLASSVAGEQIEIVKNLDYGPEDQKRKDAIRSSFANLVSYFRPGAGVDQKSAEGVKDYQANSTQTFLNNVKEEHREEILIDFIEKLQAKFFQKRIGKYKIPSGRKDPDDPKGRRNEYYIVDQEDFENEARLYANGQIDLGIKTQASAPEGSEVVDGESSMGEPIGDGEIELDMAYTLLDDEPDADSNEETKDTNGFYKKYAEEFGFSGASGMRQWFIKKPDRMFKMMVQSMMSNRVLSNLHSKTLVTILKIVAKQLPDIAHTKIINNKPVVDYDNHDPEKEIDDFANERIESGQEPIDVMDPVYEDLLERYLMKVSVSDIEQAIEQIKSNPGTLLSDISVSVDGRTMSFLQTTGGRIVVSLNALIFDKFLVKFDKDYTDFVSEKLMNDNTVKIEMEKVLGREPTITPKIAKSLSEYFTGKKEKPVLEIIKEKDEEGETFERHAFKKNEEGNYPKKGGAALLLAQGIDGETFNFLFNKVSKHLKDTILHSFKPSIEFEKEKKSDILKNYKTSVVDPMLEKFEEKGVRDQIHNSVKDMVSSIRSGS